MGRSVFDEFPIPEYDSSSRDGSSKPTKQPPQGLGPGQDPVCNGTGWLWEDAYGNQVKCWRCVGTGRIPNLVPPRPLGTIPETDDGIDGIGDGFAPDVTQEGQIVSLNQSTGD